MILWHTWLSNLIILNIFPLPVFEKEELMEALLPVYDKILTADPESLPFRQAVDPDALGIPVIQSILFLVI